jgi:hypothetical protein
VVVRDFIEDAGRLPVGVYIGSEKMPPADFLAAASDTLVSIGGSGQLPNEIKLRKGNLILEKNVTGEGAWGWVIFPEGFDAPGLIDLGKLQAWTLKPAILN